MQPRHIGGLALTLVVASTLAPGAPAPADALAARRPAVTIGGAAYPSIQAALDHARPGDTVRVPPGVFRGGLTIRESVTLAGAGAGRTVLRGGEHVITIGEPDAPSGAQPTVTISGVTLRDGRARSEPGADPSYVAAGGGVYVTPDEDGAAGRLRVVDSVVTHNRAAPAQQLVRGPVPEDPAEIDTWPICPARQYCSFAGAYGGGIYTPGDLTLVRTAVTRNVAAGSLTSDADGGGVFVAQGGSITARGSRIEANRAAARPPYGRYAEGGGVFAADDTTVRLLGSSMNRNTASLTATFPMRYDDYPEEMQPVYTDTLVNGGGVHVGDRARVEVRRSHVDRNVATYDNPNGRGGVYNSALQSTEAISFTLADSTFAGNVARARARSSEDWGANGGAVQWDTDATITRSSFVRNRTEVVADGWAWAAGAVLGLQYLDERVPTATTTMTDSVIADNSALVRSRRGPGVIGGVGLVPDTEMIVVRTRISGNRGVALTRRPNAPGTALVGGGINEGAEYNWPDYVGDDPGSTLRLVDSAVTHNSLVTNAVDARVEGGGIHSIGGTTLIRSRVAHNTPDDCDDCSGLPSP